MDGVPFATEAWIKRLADECNQSQSYRQAAKTWEGDFYFIIEPDGERSEPIYMYMDLYHGRCRQAFIPADHTALDPEFRISGPVKVWQAIAQKELDPIKAMITRRLTVRGNFAKIMQNVRAATALVNCTANFKQRFQGDVSAGDTGRHLVDKAG